MRQSGRSSDSVSKSDYSSEVTNARAETASLMSQYFTRNSHVNDPAVVKDPEPTTGSQSRPNTNSTGQQVEVTSVQYLRDNLHKLTSPEQTALQSMLEKFFGDATFRNAATRNGVIAASGPTTVRASAVCNPSSSSTTLGHGYTIYPVGSSWDNVYPNSRLRNSSAKLDLYLRKPKVFRFLELPPEIRIMVAKHVLHLPEGLSWKWVSHRKSSKIATLQNTRGRPKHTLDVINALNRTCKTVYRETRGLVLTLNTFHFDFKTMHSGHVPRDYDQSNYSTIEALLEAYTMFQRVVPYHKMFFVPQIIFHVPIRKPRVGFSTHLSHLSQVASGTPTVSLTVVVPEWNLKSPSESLVDCVIRDSIVDDDDFEDNINNAAHRKTVKQYLCLRSLMRFIGNGSKLQIELENAGMLRGNRGWRFTPDRASSEKSVLDDFAHLLSGPEQDLLRSLWFEGI